ARPRAHLPQASRDRREAVPIELPPSAIRANGEMGIIPAMLARMRWAWVPLLVLVVGCSDEATPDDDEGGGANGAGGSGAGGGSGGGPEGVCARWNADRADMSEGSWSGEVSSCSPGDVSAPGRDNALRLVNLYRFLAALPEVDHDPERNQKAQACALMMDANQSLSHTPPTSWSCYS